MRNAQGRKGKIRKEGFCQWSIIIVTNEATKDAVVKKPRACRSPVKQIRQEE